MSWNSVAFGYRRLTKCLQTNRIVQIRSNFSSEIRNGKRNVWGKNHKLQTAFFSQCQSISYNTRISKLIKWNDFLLHLGAERRGKKEGGRGERKTRKKFLLIILELFLFLLLKPEMMGFIINITLYVCFVLIIYTRNTVKDE